MIPSRFLPAPAIYEFTSKGQVAVEPSKYFKAIESESKQDQRRFKFATLKQRLISKLLPTEANAYDRPPFDLYCLSMQKNIAECICKVCGKYWPSEAAKKRHAKCHKNSALIPDEPIEPYEVTDEFIQIQVEDSIEEDEIQVLETDDDMKNFVATPFIIVTRKVDIGDEKNEDYQFEDDFLN